MPGALQLLRAAKGSRPIAIDRAPGVEFRYGDLGYLVLEALLEVVLKQPIRYAIAPFLRRVGLGAFTFYTPSVDQADGYLDGGERVAPRGGRVYPNLATGGRCPPSSYAAFLHHLAAGYADATPRGDAGPISRSTARRMLDAGRLVDGGAVESVGAMTGLGVFVATCGPNRIAVHQAATEGFRAVYLVCFDGPNAAAGPTGFVAVANGDEAASFLLSDVCQSMLRRLDWEGVDLTRVENPRRAPALGHPLPESKKRPREPASPRSGARADRLAARYAAEMIKHAPKDAMVNTGYKDLVFKAFGPAP